jgi:hypothetical protein
VFFDNYNTLKLLDENICDAKLIQLVVISTFSYIRNALGNEMYSYFKYPNTTYGKQPIKSNLTQVNKWAIYSECQTVRVIFVKQVMIRSMLCRLNTKPIRK